MAKKVQRDDGWFEYARTQDSLDDAIEEYNVVIKPKIRRKRRKRKEKGLKDDE